MRKTALVLIPLLLILHLIFAYHHLFVDFNIKFNFYGTLLQAVFILFSLIAMLALGTFRKTKMAIGACFGMAALIVGLVFRIQHWEGSQMSFTLGFIVMGVFYLWHFITKVSKRLLDWVKIIYVAIAAMGYPVLADSWVPDEEPLGWLIFFVAMVLITVFYISILKPPSRAVPALSDEGGEVFRYPD